MFQRAHLTQYSLLLVLFLASCPDDNKDSSGETEDNQDTLTLTSITPDHAFEGDDADADTDADADALGLRPVWTIEITR